MAALLGSIALSGGKRIELYEGGTLWLIDSLTGREIAMGAEDALEMHTFLGNWQSQLAQVVKLREQHYEEVYGPLCKFSEHRRGEIISYRSAEGDVRTGEILWVKGPQTTAKSQRDIGITYIVDAGRGMPEMVWPADVRQEKE